MTHTKSKQLLYSLQDVSFRYVMGAEQVVALNHVNLEISKGSFLSIVGPSGSGKSTLLNLLGLIESLQEGEIRLYEEGFSSMSAQRKNEIRKFHIGFIFQHFHLIPVLSAEENVAYFLQRQGLAQDKIVSQTQKALELVGLWDIRKRRPGEMSGGQKQRVAIARALAKSPEVIIADEPTASLDQKTGREVMDIFQELVAANQITVILTTHDPMVMELTHQNIHMKDGCIL